MNDGSLITFLHKKVKFAHLPNQIFGNCKVTWEIKLDIYQNSSKRLQKLITATLYDSISGYQHCM